MNANVVHPSRVSRPAFLASAIRIRRASARVSLFRPGKPTDPHLPRTHPTPIPPTIMTDGGESEPPTKVLKQSSQLGNLGRPQVAILDFGSQYSHLIARRVRELNVYCELYSCLVDPAELAAHELTAIILSGGPSSVYEEGAPHVSQGIWDLIEERGVPVLGICYGMQEIAQTFGGRVAPGQKREYGKAAVSRSEGCDCALFEGLPDAFTVWMSHGDKLHELPEGFRYVAGTENAEFVAMENLDKRMWGLQFHPEVTHSQGGKDMLRNFVVGIAGAKQDWVMTDYAKEFIEQVREKVGPTGNVIGAVSGGVDSTVAAVLMKEAIGDRFHAVLVDNGCLRKNETETVLKRLNYTESEKAVVQKDAQLCAYLMRVVPLSDASSAVIAKKLPEGESGYLSIFCALVKK